MRIMLGLALAVIISASAHAAAKRCGNPNRYPEKEWCNAHDWPKACRCTPME